MTFHGVCGGSDRVWCFGNLMSPDAFLSKLKVFELSLHQEPSWCQNWRTLILLLGEWFFLPLKLQFTASLAWWGTYWGTCCSSSTMRCRRGKSTARRWSPSSPSVSIWSQGSYWDQEVKFLKLPGMSYFLTLISVMTKFLKVCPNSAAIPTTGVPAFIEQVPGS